MSYHCTSRTVDRDIWANLAAERETPTPSHSIRTNLDSNGNFAPSQRGIINTSDHHGPTNESLHASVNVPATFEIFYSYDTRTLRTGTKKLAPRSYTEFWLRYQWSFVIFMSLGKIQNKREAAYRDRCGQRREKLRRDPSIHTQPLFLFMYVQYMRHSGRRGRWLRRDQTDQKKKERMADPL